MDGTVSRRSGERLALSRSTPRGRPPVDRLSLLPVKDESKRDAKKFRSGNGSMV